MRIDADCGGTIDWEVRTAGWALLGVVAASLLRSLMHGWAGPYTGSAVCMHCPGVLATMAGAECMA